MKVDAKIVLFESEGLMSWTCSKMVVNSEIYSCIAIVFCVKDESLFLATIELPNSENLSCIMPLIASQFKPKLINSLMCL